MRTNGQREKLQKSPESKRPKVEIPYRRESLVSTWQISNNFIFLPLLLQKPSSIKFQLVLKRPNQAKTETPITIYKTANYK
jgi:hypothetical protein